MSEKSKAIIMWSGGKDAAFALYLSQQKFEVVALVTTINKVYNRVSMHGVRENVIEKQSEEIGIPLYKMYVEDGTNEEYEQVLTHTYNHFKQQGISHVIYGDIFLEDLKAYRDNLLLKAGLIGEYPLWNRNTKELVHESLQLGFKTITCCISDKYLKKEHVGKVVSASFSADIANTSDPCGENGEYHSVVVNAPYFKNELQIKVGELVYKPIALSSNTSTKLGFWFADIQLQE